MIDELKQEAEEKYFKHKMADFQDFYPRHYYCLGYLDSAEPREKRIVELEKENAELKSKNCWKTCEYAEPKSQLISQHIQDVAQLTKAKEIIKDYMTIVKGNHTTVCGVPEENRTIYVLKLNEEAEQFLKEVCL